MKFDLYGDINPKMVEDLGNWVVDNYKEGEKVLLTINSNGGFINAAVTISEIIRYIQSFHSEVTIINIGDVMSAATIIWLSCNRRIWNPQYDFLIHSPYIQNVTGNADELIEQAIELTGVEGDIVELYCTISGKTEDEVLDLMKQERPMTFDELVDYHFITGYTDDGKK